MTERTYFFNDLTKELAALKTDNTALMQTASDLTLELEAAYLALCECGSIIRKEHLETLKRALEWQKGKK